MMKRANEPIAADLTEKEFSQHIGAKFCVELDSAQIELKLAEVQLLIYRCSRCLCCAGSVLPHFYIRPYVLSLSIGNEFY